jgi:hypothetical protein
MQLEKRFWIAMAAYVILGTLAWLTMDATPVQIAGSQISFRGITLVVLGFFAVQTVLRFWKIRAERKRGFGFIDKVEP